MAEAKTLHDAFLDELRDAYDAEQQLTKALPKMAKAATSPDLRTAFENNDRTISRLADRTTLAGLRRRVPHSRGGREQCGAGRRDCCSDGWSERWQAGRERAQRHGDLCR
jgi:hypothetical protein